MNKCESCKFFEQNAPKTGVCHRMPPTPFPIAPEKVASYWPNVQLQQWCGEWAIRLVIASEIPADPREVMQ
jgi:hypothetical protein